MKKRSARRATLRFKSSRRGSHARVLVSPKIFATSSTICGRMDCGFCLDDVLFLKGIDMGVVDEDNLRLLKKRDPVLYAGIEQRVHYVTRLYNNEFHVVARNEIKSLDDLRGKKVSFNLKNSQTEVTADAIFSMLNIDVERVYYGNNEAMLKLREGESQL